MIEHVNGWYMPANDFNICQSVRDNVPYQQKMLDMAFDYVKDWSIAIDVGAHIGLHSRRLLQRFKQVIAFEPHPENLECLRLNITKPRLTIYDSCAGERTRTCGLAYPDPAREDGLIDSGRYRVTESGNVTMRTIDSVCISPKVDKGKQPSQHKSLPVGLIKIDTEGYEPMVIYGALLTIMAAKPVILCEDLEHYEDYGCERWRVSRILTGLGYSIIDRSGSDSVYAFR